MQKLTDNDLSAALAALNIHRPTKVQELAIPPMLEGRDIIASSETGTGKTFAYLLPIYMRLDDASKNVQAHILSPTHELAAQIQRQCELINAGLPEGRKARTALLIGSASAARQIEALKLKPEIVIGSAARINELAEMKKLKLHFVKTIVLDEGDRLLDKKNRVIIERVIKHTQRDRQLTVFSATLTRESQEAAQALMKEPLVLDAKSLAMPEGIGHLYINCGLRDKQSLLRKILAAEGVEKALVFVNNPYILGETVDKLKHSGVSCEALAGDSRGMERKKAVDGLTGGKLKVVAATDLASRGLDIAGVSHIINLDFPQDAETYLHRAGRTGRAGRVGTVISLTTAGELAALRKTANELNIEIREAALKNGKVAGLHLG